MQKGSHHTEESKAKISRKMQGNLHGLIHGGRSKQVAKLATTHCKGCPLHDRCPQRVEAGDSVCPLGEFAVLARDLGGEELYEFSTLVDFLGSTLRINALRFADGIRLEQEEGMGLDPEVTRLFRELVNGTMRLARLLGYDRPDPQVLIDRRVQSLEVHIGSLSPEEYKKALEALADLRKIDGALADRLLEHG